MSVYLYIAILHNRASKALKLYSVPNGITLFYLCSTRFIPVRAKQDFEHYLRNELLSPAAHLYYNLDVMT
jgi:hypothetical protein